MPITAEWVNEKRWLKLTGTGEATLETIAELIHTLRIHVSEGTTPVYVLIDLTQITAFPTNLREVVESAQVKPNDRIGWVVIAADAMMLRFLGAILAQLARHPAHTVTTAEEGLAFLSSVEAQARRDAQLHDS